MHDPMTLYHYWRSSCSWRIRWALNYKQIPHRLIHIDILKQEQKSPQFLHKNPAGLVPTLHWKGQYYSESLAILEGLEDSFPQRPLLPNDAESRMRARQLALIVVAGTQPLQNLGVLNYYSSDPSKKKEFASHFISEGLANYERILENSGSGTFSCGSQLTIADLVLIPQCYNALRNDIDLNAYPLVQNIYKHCLTMETCRKAAPENHQPTVQ